MKVVHISDTHGQFKAIPKFTDLVIHSGDILPDAPTRMNFNGYALWQENWLKNNLGVLKSWVESTPIIFIGGNHDYMKASKIEEMFLNEGINAQNAEDKIVSFNGLNIYGFPWVKAINGSFNYELNNQGMKLKCNELKTILESNYIDILVAHGAMTGGLSNEGFCDYGNNFLEDSLMSTKKENVPSYMFVGHLHNAKGIKYRNDLEMLIVNSATTMHIIDI